MQQQNTQKVEASKVPEYIKKAAKKAAEFNSNLNRERMEERRAYFDLQTHVGTRPRARRLRAGAELGLPGRHRPFLPPRIPRHRFRGGLLRLSLPEPHVCVGGIVCFVGYADSCCVPRGSLSKIFRSVPLVFSAL